MALEPLSGNTPQVAPPVPTTESPPSKTCCIFTRCCCLNSCASTLNLRIKKISTYLCSSIKSLCSKIFHAINSFFKFLWDPQLPHPKVQREQPKKEVKQPSPTKTPAISQESPLPCDNLGWQEVKERHSLSLVIKTKSQETPVTETATPIPTRDAAKERLLKAQKMLNDRLPSHETSVLLDICTKALRSIQGREQDWVHSSGIRETCERENPENLAFVEQANCYQQGVNVNGQNYELLRLGTPVHTNGFTDLETLEKAVETNSSIKKVERLEQILSQGFFTKKNEPLNEPQKRGLELAILDLKDPRKALIQRRFLFEQQMLFLINTQVQSHPPQGDSFILWHQSLLNPSKKEFEKEGWMHNEQRELKDLAFIFKEFDGKTICFGSKKTIPYISERGTIHLPAPDGVREGKRITLKTRLINISVQNHEKESIPFQQNISGDYQQKFEELFITQSKELFGIEADSLDALEHSLTTALTQEKNQERWVELQKVKNCIPIYKRCQYKFRQSSSRKGCPFKFATHAALIPFLLKVPFSTESLNAIDRVGYLCGRLTIRLTIEDLKAKKTFIDQHMMQYHDIDKKKYCQYKNAAELLSDDIRALFSHLDQPLEKTSLAMDIVKANCSDQTHLKAKVAPTSLVKVRHSLRCVATRLSLPRKPD